jgi:hypothetical protein
MDEVLRWKGLSNEQKFEEGFLKLRRSGQYEPTVDVLKRQHFVSTELAKDFQEELLSLQPHRDQLLDLHIADINQRYSQSCYD